MSEFLRLCRPDSYYKSVFDIDFNDYYYNKNYRYLLFDIDNTILKDNDNYIPDIVFDLFFKLKNIGFVNILVSNNSENRVRPVADALGLEYVYKAGKPRREAFNKVRNVITGFDFSKAIMIGDQIFTDIYGANKLGMHTVLVDRISKKECLPVRIKRVPEFFVKKIIKI